MSRVRNMPVARSRAANDHGPAAAIHTHKRWQTSRVQRYPYAAAMNTAEKRQMTVWRLAGYWVMGTSVAYAAAVLALIGSRG